MPTLEIEENFPLQNFLTEVSPNDTMFTSSEHYVNVGLSALRIFDYAVSQSFVRLEDLNNILDLPCGHGRVARVLRSRFPGADLTVCDLDRDGVDYCVTHLGVRGVYSTEDFDALDLGKRFDLIWVGSLITHFNASKTVKFIRCMQRHLSEDGLLIITNHGKYVAEYNAASRPQIVNQYNVLGYGYEGTGEYGGSIISRHWLEGFFAGEKCAIISYLEREWDNNHDVFFVRGRDLILPPKNVPKADCVGSVLEVFR